MAKRIQKPLTVVNMISFNGKDGEYKPLKECTSEELELFHSKVKERVSRSLSDYYSVNPDEFEKLLRGSQNDTA